MTKDFQYLLTEISVEVDSQYGPCIRLVDWDHRDYIEDVLIEIYDVEYDFSKEHDDSTITIYFTDLVSLHRVVLAVGKINEFHKTNKREFELPSAT